MDTSPSSHSHSQPTAAQLDRVLLEIMDWKAEKKAENIAFYADALVHNRIHIVVEHEFTIRVSNCDCCLGKQQPGIRKFFHSNGTCFYFWVCPGCWQEIMEAADMSALVACQINTGALA